MWGSAGNAAKRRRCPAVYTLGVQSGRRLHVPVAGVDVCLKAVEERNEGENIFTYRLLFVTSGVTKRERW